MGATLVDILVQAAFVRHIGGVLLATVNTYYLFLSTFCFPHTSWVLRKLISGIQPYSTPGTRVGLGTRERPLAAEAPVGDRKNFKWIEFDKAKTAFSPIA